MGLLDDAIREHLELKRKHGADEETVKRELDEALGPARRDISHAEVPAEAGAAETARAPEPEGASAAALGEFDVEIDEFMGTPDEHGLTEPPEHPPPTMPDRAESWGGSSVFADELRAAEAGAAEPVEADDAPPASGPELDPDLDPAHDEIDAEGAAPAGEAPRRDTPPQGFAALDPGGPFGGDEPFADEPEKGEGGEEGDHDVLEDTPEFLQETPEHDRLWFEQKPPRDFDFDEE